MNRKMLLMAFAAIAVLLATSIDVKAWVAYRAGYRVGGYGAYRPYSYYGGYHYGVYGGGYRYGYARRW
jgi:hypothetical protein